MRVLLVKQSSLGDIFHCFPALSEAMDAIPGIRFDWVVEEGFSEVPNWHPAVGRAIPISLRRWRKHLLSPLTWREISGFVKDLRALPYDLIIDAQALMKSAPVARAAKGACVGLSWSSIRTEAYASLLYHRTVVVPLRQHAILRLRRLFATALCYQIDEQKFPDYRLHITCSTTRPHFPYLVALHGSTWQSKQIPSGHWIELLEHAHREGLRVLFPWGSEAECAFANRLARHSSAAVVLGDVSLRDIVCLMKGAVGIISVDTGLAHVAASLNVPMVSVFSSTNPYLTRPLGSNVSVVSAQYPCAPCMRRHCKYTPQNNPRCFQSLPANVIYQALQQRMSQRVANENGRH